MALGTGLNQPRFNTWVTVGCASFLLLLIVAVIMATVQEDTDPALLELYNAKEVSFYNGSIVAPKWQQLLTGFFTAEQVEEDINYYSKFSREEFRRLHSHYTK